VRTASIALLALSGFALVGCAQKPKEYVYPAWGFAVSFASPPAATDIPASADGQSPHEFRVELTKDGHDLTVEAIDAAGSTQSDEQVLEHAPQAIADGMGGDLTSQTPITQGGVPGRELHIDRQGQTTLVIRLFSANHHLYQVAAQSQSGPSDAGAKAFLDSFHLTAPYTPSAPAANDAAANTASNAAATNAPANAAASNAP
jgi:hypothetical protein